MIALKLNRYIQKRNNKYSHVRRFADFFFHQRQLRTKDSFWQNSFFGFFKKTIP